MLKLTMISDVDKNKSNLLLLTRFVLHCCLTGKFFKEGPRDDFGCQWLRGLLPANSQCGFNKFEIPEDSSTTFRDLRMYTLTTQI